MKAIILAAGKGSRLGDITKNTPKCLLKIKDKAILDYQLSALFKSGIKDIIIITGYCSDQVNNFVSDRCKTIFNEDYESTNSIYSLWLAKDELYSHEFVLFNSDVVAEEDLIINSINNNKRCSSLVEIDNPLKDGEMNVVIKEGKIIKIGKNIKSVEADGESVQITKFGVQESKLLFGHIEQLIKEGHVDKFPAFAYDIIFEKSAMWPVFTNGKKWYEIDNTVDLKRAESIFSQ